MLEPRFATKGQWMFPTETPSLADISLYYQLRWGIDIAAGRGIENLSGGVAKNTEEDVTGKVFNKERYPGLWAWFHAFEAHIASLPDLQATNPDGWLDAVKESEMKQDSEFMVPTAGEYQLDLQGHLVPGVHVSVAPDDTGCGNPTLGTLVKIGIEEVVIKPHEKAEVDVLVHFPRLGFVVKVVKEVRL
jgi:hypothetical protein